MPLTGLLYSGRFRCILVFLAVNILAACGDTRIYVPGARTERFPAPWTEAASSDAAAGDAGVHARACDANAGGAGCDGLPKS
jgi:hypothetical protein